jgi:hypothetical protein
VPRPAPFHAPYRYTSAQEHLNLKEKLIKAQRLADIELQTEIARKEREAQARWQRQRIDNERDPKCRSQHDILQRSLMLLRVPPPYSALAEAIDRHKAQAVKLAAARAEKRRAEQATAIFERDAPINKSRRISDKDLWSNLLSSSGGVKAKTSKPADGQAASRVSRNPYASQPPPKKRVI